MRALGVVLLLVLTLIAGVAAALWWFPAPLLRTALRAGGVEAVRFEDLRLGAGAIEVEGLQIGAPPEQRVARLRIDYRLGDLLRGRLTGVEIEGLELYGRLVDGRIELAGVAAAPDDGEAARLPVAWPERVVLEAAEIHLATPWGELHAPLAAELVPGSPATFRLATAGGELINGAGRLRADLEMTGSAPLTPALALADVTAQGRLELTAERFALPELAGGVDGSAAATFELAGGRLQAELQDGELGVAELAPRLSFLIQPLPPPWRIDLNAAGKPMRVSGQLAVEELAVELDGALRLAAGPATVEVELAAQLAAGERGRLTASASLNDLRWPAAGLERGTLEFAGEGSAEVWQGTIDLALEGAAQPTGELALQATTLRHRLALSFAGRELTMTARQDGELAVGRFLWQGKGEAGPLALVLQPADGPLLSAKFPATGGVTWQQRLRAAGEGFDFSAGSAATALRGRAALELLTLALEGDEAGLTAGRVALERGRLRMPEQQLILDGIATELALGFGGLAPDQIIPLRVATVSHGGAPPWFAPLRLEAELRPGAEAVAFDARLSGAADGVRLALRGRHGPASGRGAAEIELEPLTFAPGRLQPRELAPATGDLLREVSGMLALDGTVAWGAGDQVSAELALLVEDLAFTAGPASFSRINGVVEFDRLWPPSTPPGQQLAIGLVDLGLPLSRGLMVFELLPEGTFAVERLRWDFAGGRVSAAPFRVGSEASDIMLTLSAERLDLAELFALTRLDGLSGEGRIGGTLPVRISGTEAVIAGGELRAAGPGWLRYRSEGVPAALQAGGENVSLLLQALENFRYEALRITLDGRTDAEMDIGLHVEGANPDLYGGYPIAFNLNLEGELANILRSGLASYQIPERIRERMQGFR